MEIKARVALIPCEDYREESTDAAIAKGFELLGGVAVFFNQNEKILLKPNLLAKAAPEKAVTTHPAVFRSVGKYLLEHGYNQLSYGDSPGNPIGGVAKVAEGCGIGAPARELGIQAADFSCGQEIEFERGITETHFIISKGILESDAIVNICKMKTHQLERITGAAKNMFGSVYGINKGAFHAKYTDADSFGKMIADLNKYTNARLHIMDGVMAMEGNGPRSGAPVEMKMILMSADPIALDSVFCALIDLKPELVPTNKYGEKYKVGTMDPEKIQVLTPEGPLSATEVIETYGKKDFDVYRGVDEETQIRLLQPLQPYLIKRPVIKKASCIKCGICIDSCPLEKKAVEMKKYPKYDYKLCIRCYCCQEMCPQKAIEVKTPLLAKVMDRNWKL